MKVKKPLLDETTLYAERVVAGNIPACRYVRLACRRHLNDLLRKDIWFDVRAARRFFRYCEMLSHYKGPDRGKPIKLELWQKFVFGNIYGWKRVIDGEKTDLWRFNVNYIEIPRKNGKTTISAAAASYDAALCEETGAEVYCLATKEDQAMLLYNDIAAYIAKSPALAKVFEILKGKKTIYASDSARTSFIKPLGADSQRLDGLNPLSAYCDELHAWPERDLWDVMMEAFGARTNWHMTAITTAGNNREGICYDERDHVINILEGRMVADNKFGIIYTVDKEQEVNWRDERNWYIANPNLGTGKQLEYMRTRCLAAIQQPSSLNAFLNKQLNIWTDVAEAWLNVDQWMACGMDYKPTFLNGKHCIVALDLARVNDLSAVAYVFPKQLGLDCMHVLVDYYMPKDSIKAKGHRDRMNYSDLSKQGWIVLTDGPSTDYEYIRRDIKAKSTALGFRVDEITYDRHFSGELVVSLSQDGFKMEETGMGFISMAFPTAELERLVVCAEFRHNNNPILNWNAANVVIRRDAANNIKPDKELSIKKIDGIVAIIMGIGRVPRAAGPSVYEKRGFLKFGLNTRK
jgi:phage terminase large subunit-like protein